MQLHHREADGGCGVQDLVQRIRKWWSSGIDIWVSICLVRGDTSSSGHGRDGFDVCFRHGELYDLVPFVLLLRRDLRRIWISFRQHPHDSALGRRVGGGRPFGPRYSALLIDNRATILAFPCTSTGAVKVLEMAVTVSQNKKATPLSFADKEAGSR